MNIRVENRKPTVLEYQILRSSTKWPSLEDKVVEKALSNSLFSVCVFLNNKIVGIGRVIGDGAAYFYIQDVIVLPDFHKMGIGEKIMIEIENWLKQNANHNSFVGLMAAINVKEFYKKFDYKERGNDRPGMYKVIEKI